MIELDVLNPDDELKAYITSIWPDDEYLYVYDEGEHYYIKCDECTFWDGNYTITLKYEQYALIRLIIYHNHCEAVYNITKNKRRRYY